MARWISVYLQRAVHVSGNKTDIHRAIGLWVDTHGERTLYCLVQFEGVALNQLPRIYLATPAEIAGRMRAAAERTGEPLLHEKYEWTDPDTRSTEIETLPSSWMFSHERVQELLFPHSAQPIPMPAARAGLVRMEIRPAAMSA
jgi:hypothetical protein